MILLCCFYVQLYRFVVFVVFVYIGISPIEHILMLLAKIAYYLPERFAEHDKTQRQVQHGCTSDPKLLLPMPRAHSTFESETEKTL